MGLFPWALRWSLLRLIIIIYQNWSIVSFILYFSVIHKTKSPDMALKPCNICTLKRKLVAEILFKINNYHHFNLFCLVLKVMKSFSRDWEDMMSKACMHHCTFGLSQIVHFCTCNMNCHCFRQVIKCINLSFLQGGCLVQTAV